MPQKICRHCGEPFTLLPGKPGYADECPRCLHEKTRPQAPPNAVDAYLRRYPKERRNLAALRRAFLNFVVDESTADRLIAEFVVARLQG